MLKKLGDDWGSYGRLRLINLSNAENNASFIPYLKEALALIERTHPRHYRRIERETWFIINGSNALKSGGVYVRQIRACHIDFSLFTTEMPQTDEREWWIAALATGLIHEATHGHLMSRGIPYNKKTRVRCERICNQEEQRLSARLHGERYSFESLVRPFDEARWYPYWNISPWQKWKAAFRHVRGEKDEGPKR